MTISFGKALDILESVSNEVTVYQPNVADSLKAIAVLCENVDEIISAIKTRTEELQDKIKEKDEEIAEFQAQINAFEEAVKVFKPIKEAAE